MLVFGLQEEEKVGSCPAATGGGHRGWKRHLEPAKAAAAVFKALVFKLISCELVPVRTRTSCKARERNEPL